MKIKKELKIEKWKQIKFIKRLEKFDNKWIKDIESQYWRINNFFSKIYKEKKKRWISKIVHFVTSK